MHKLIFLASVVVLLSTFIAPAASLAQEPADDELDIRRQIERWEAAWNQGGARAIADFYDEDADRTYAHGITRSGKSQIYDLYQEVFSADLPEDVEQKLSLEILSVRLLTGDVAVVDYAYHTTGIPIAPYLTVDGRSTVVMVKRDGKWLRSVQRNWIPTNPECMKLCQQEAQETAPLDAPPIKQEFLVRAPLAQFPGKQVTVLRGEFQPGAVTPLHRHPATEMLYVLQGGGIMRIQGRDSLDLTAGKMVLVEPRAGEDAFVHQVVNTSSTEVLKTLVIIVHDEGSPPAVVLEDQ